MKSFNFFSAVAASSFKSLSISTGSFTRARQLPIVHPRIECDVDNKIVTIVNRGDFVEKVKFLYFFAYTHRVARAGRVSKVDKFFRE